MYDVEICTTSIRGKKAVLYVSEPIVVLVVVIYTSSGLTIPGEDPYLL